MRVVCFLCCFSAVSALSCSSQSVNLKGAGSANAADFVDYAIRRYQMKRKLVGHDVVIEYRGVSSSYGRKQVVNSVDGVHFAISDASIDHTVGPGIYNAVIGGSGLRIIYHIPGVPKLRLTVADLAAIFSGRLTKWSDQSLRDRNPKQQMPAKPPIAVIPRADQSGTTTVLTTAKKNFRLSLADEEWAREFGIFSDPDFPQGFCCKDSRNWKKVPELYGLRVYGMLGVVSSVPNSIGYVLEDVSGQKDIGVVTVINGAKVDTTPSEKFVSAAMRAYHHEQNGDEKADLKFLEEYPFSILHHAILNFGRSSSCCDKMELVGFIEEMTELTQEEIERTGAVILPDELKTSLIDMLSRIECGGENMLEAYIASSKTTNQLTSVIIGCCTAIALATGITTAVAVRRFRQSKSTAMSEWLINPLDISNDKNGSQEGGSKSQSRLTINRSLHEQPPQSGTPEHSAQSALTPGHVGYGTYGALQLKVHVVHTAFVNPNSFTRVTQESLVALKHNMLSSHLQKFIGITTTAGLTSFVYERSTRGSVHDVLQNTRYTLSEQLRFGFVADAIKGISFLHSHNIVHGHISSLNLFFADNWTIKVGRWAEMQVSQSQKLAMEHINSVDITDLSAENVIRLVYSEGRVISGIVDRYSDVYATAVLALEVLANHVPFTRPNELTKHLAEKFSSKKITTPPEMPELATGLQDLLVPFLNAKDHDQTIKEMLFKVETLNPCKTGIVETMLETMEGHMIHLEDKVAVRTAELSHASDRMKELLYAVLPMQIANKLINSEIIQPEYFESATLYFSDIVGFTNISSKSTPTEVMAFLNDLWQKYDSIIPDFDCYKVDTIGDAYLVCSGLPERNGKKHVREIIALAKALREATRTFNIRHLPNERPGVRIGVHSGPVTAGIVGAKLPQYCLFGETVNTAMAMESASETMKIHISDVTFELLQKFFPEEFTITPRGEQLINGKVRKTYFAE